MDEGAAALREQPLIPFLRLRRRAPAFTLVLSLTVGALSACDRSGDQPPLSGGSGTTGTSAPAPPPPTTTGEPDPTVDVDGPPATLLAAGDIASCDSRGDEATAALLDERPDGTVATLGDNVYPSGTSEQFARCYDPSWGRHKARTRPAPGNHDYATPGAEGYYEYFGEVAGDPDRGYYSYDLGTWHIVALNSNCEAVSCAVGSEQERWLRADLATHPARCTLAYWHHPRFSSGVLHSSDSRVDPLFTALYEAKADVVLAGHEHNYERLAPTDPVGNVDRARGVRGFVVGTGGRSLYTFGVPLPASEVRDAETYGILALTLRAGGYDWEFVPEAGATFTDRGSDVCR